MRFETVEEQLTKIAHVGRGCCCCYLLYPYPFVGQFGNYQLKGECENGVKKNLFDTRQNDK